MSKRERTRVGEVRYGFDFVFPDAWIPSVTREAGIHHHITCSKVPLSTTNEALLYPVKTPHPTACGLQLGSEPPA